MPYRTSENRINGVAVTFNDISTLILLAMEDITNEKILSHAIEKNISPGSC
ncbi:MAG: hypothetical protein M0Q13_09940 [Methanothrix sp.]|jgi:hypothetical protein|nr:hypothetical protein [Methanothrix sp.]